MIFLTIEGLKFATLSWRRSLSYRNQSIDLHRKSMDWFLYDRELRHERVTNFNPYLSKNIILFTLLFSGTHAVNHLALFLAESKQILYLAGVVKTIHPVSANTRSWYNANISLIWSCDVGRLQRWCDVSK